MLEGFNTGSFARIAETCGSVKTKVRPDVSSGIAAQHTEGWVGDERDTPVMYGLRQSRVRCRRFCKGLRHRGVRS